MKNNKTLGVSARLAPALVCLFLAGNVFSQSNSNGGTDTPTGGGGLTPLVLNGGWQSFNWGEGAPVDADDQFTISGAACVSIVDAYCAGDRFTLIDGVTNLGSTTPPQSIECDFEGATDDPDEAINNLAYSQGAFNLGAGDHELVISVIENPHDGGGAFIRADTTCYGDEVEAGEARATFKVTKYFDDGNDEDEITVSIDCNTGLVLDQDKELGNGEWVEFVVTDFTPGNLACTITEDGTAGYSGVYVNESIIGAPVESDEGCFYAASEIPGTSAHECVITNYPDPVDVTVTKEWVYAGNSSHDIDSSYTLTLYCDAYIEGGYGIKGDNQQGIVKDDYYGCGSKIIPKLDQPAANFYDWCKAFPGNGEGDYTAEVTPEFPGSNCIWVETHQDQAVEVDQSDCQSLEISAGNGASCTIINTVFFEGIPTLGQYGMAILALLMLGVGFVSFRRFS
jgi:hypothetical protein